MSVIMVIRTENEPEKRVEITDEEITLGRSKNTEVPINDPKLSSKHCTLRLQDGQCFLKDLESTNGTFVNKKKIHKTFIYIGDKIALGNTRMRLSRKLMDADEVLHHGKSSDSKAVDFTKMAADVVDSTDPLKLELDYKTVHKPKDILKNVHKKPTKP